MPERQPPSFLVPFAILSLTIFPVAFLASLSLTEAQCCAALSILFLTSLSTFITVSIVKKHGILTFASPGLRQLLLEANILDWLTNSTFFDSNIAPWLPLLMNPTYKEMIAVLSHMNPTMKQAILQKGGFGRLLPGSMRSWLHPDMVKYQPPLELPSEESPSSTADPTTTTRTTRTTTTPNPHPSPTPGTIFSNQIFQNLVLPPINRHTMWKSSAVAFGCLFIMLSRSKVARRTSSSLFHAIALLGLGGTAIGTFLIGYFNDQNNKRTPKKRGMEAAQLVLRAVRMKNQQHPANR